MTNLPDGGANTLHVMTDADYMQLAVAKAQEGIEAGQTPFGSAIVLDGRVLAVAHNTVWRDRNPTAHAEINAIRKAAAVLGQIALRGCTLYTTCEPCPMCLSASHWAKIERVVYGASIADAAAAGFAELHLPARDLAQLGGSPLVVEAGPGRDECRELFALWKRRGLSAAY